MSQSKFRTRSTELLNSDSGILLAEFAMMFALLVFVTFCAVEFSRYLRTSELATTLSRELANSVYRECGSPGNTAGNIDTLGICANAVLDRMNTFAETLNIDSVGTLATNFYFSVRVYHRAAPLVPSYKSTTTDTTHATLEQQHFQWPGPTVRDVSSTFGTPADLRSVMVVGSVWLRYTMFSTFLNSLIPGMDTGIQTDNNNGRWYYAVSNV